MRPLDVGALGADPDDHAVERDTSLAQQGAGIGIVKRGLERLAHERVAHGLRAGQGPGITAKIRQLGGDLVTKPHKTPSLKVWRFSNGEATYKFPVIDRAVGVRDKFSGQENKRLGKNIEKFDFFPIGREPQTGPSILPMSPPRPPSRPSGW